VSIAEQRMWACAGRSLAFTSPVTTGDVRNGWSTPTGRWQIYAKQTNRWLSGPGYGYRVRYWLPFYGSFGFHDASWQTEPFGGTTYRDHGSRGCVHLPTVAMRELFNWASVGTTVVVEA
jgi:lipoprotein-anchoring transpeptidase ErfK/SrfK